MFEAALPKRGATKVALPEKDATKQTNKISKEFHFQKEAIQSKNVIFNIKFNI